MGQCSTAAQYPALSRRPAVAADCIGATLLRRHTVDNALARAEGTGAAEAHAMGIGATLTLGDECLRLVTIVLGQDALVGARQRICVETKDHALQIDFIDA